MDDAIRRKLLADAEGTGDDRRLALLSKMFLRWASDDHSTAQSDAIHKKMQQAIGQSQCNTRKTQLAHRTCLDELDYYAGLAKRITDDTNTAHRKIAECRRALQEAKQIRKHRQEYDAMAALIKQHRSREDSARSVDQAKGELERAGEKTDQCRKQLEQRRKQLHVLFVSLRELNELMNKTNRDE